METSRFDMLPVEIREHFLSYCDVKTDVKNLCEAYPMFEEIVDGSLLISRKLVREITNGNVDEMLSSNKRLLNVLIDLRSTYLIYDTSCNTGNLMKIVKRIHNEVQILRIYIAKVNLFHESWFAEIKFENLVKLDLYISGNGKESSGVASLPKLKDLVVTTFEDFAVLEHINCPNLNTLWLYDKGGNRGYTFNNSVFRWLMHVPLLKSLRTELCTYIQDLWGHPPPKVSNDVTFKLDNITWSHSECADETLLYQQAKYVKALKIFRMNYDMLPILLNQCINLQTFSLFNLNNVCIPFELLGERRLEKLSKFVAMGVPTSFYEFFKFAPNVKELEIMQRAPFMNLKNFINLNDIYEYYPLIESLHVTEIVACTVYFSKLKNVVFDSFNSVDHKHRKYSHVRPDTDDIIEFVKNHPHVHIEINTDFNDEFKDKINTALGKSCNTRLKDENIYLVVEATTKARPNRRRDRNHQPRRSTRKRRQVNRLHQPATKSNEEQQIDDKLRRSTRKRKRVNRFAFGVKTHLRFFSFRID